MKPVDCRNETWKDVTARLNDARDRAYRVVQVFGPGTTKTLAEAAGCSLWTLRPRVCELMQMGLVEMVGDVRGREGIYRAVPLEEAERRFEAARRGEAQLEMKLGA